MDRQSDAGVIDSIRRNPLLPIAILALALLLLVVWREGDLLPPSASQVEPAGRSQTPAAAAPTSPLPTAPPERWVALPSLLDGTINSLVVEHPDGVPVVYAGTDGGVFKSLDQGRTWISCNDGLGDRLVRSLALNPDDPRALYAGTWNGKVHVSTDGGNSWTDRSTGLPPMQVLALAVHTHDPRKLYGATAAGVYTTTDSGEHWYPSARITATVQCMVMDPEHPDTLYVGTADEGIFKTLDGGLSWFRLREKLADVSALVLPPRTEKTLYAIAGGEVWKTETDGFVWSYADSWRDASVARSLAVNSKNPQEVYVGMSDGLHRSDNARQSWAPSQSGLAEADVSIVVVDPIEPSVIYACSGNELFVSPDSGHSWEPRSGIQGYKETRILALKADPQDGNAFYATVDGGGLFKTTNQGQHWEHVGEGLPLASMTAVEVDPVDSATVYVGSKEGIVFRSSCCGRAWVFGHRVAEAPISTLTIDPEQRNRIYAGTQGQGLYRSDDQGAAWMFAGSDIGTDIQQVVIDPRGPGVTVYATTEEGVFRSIDAGISWELHLSMLGILAPPLKSTTQLVAITRVEPDRVTGQGVGDTILVPQSRIGTDAEVEAMITSTAAPDTLYALAQGLGVTASTDSGTTWSALGSGLETLELWALALSADDPNLILVGTERGIYQYRPPSQ
jgi:photosystem II stability/assembly factor-like uncharacterized protein